MPRFVVLRHVTPDGYRRPLHWDFMLEWGEVLRTWALDEQPSIGATVNAQSLGDHRMAYLEYEGPVSNDRGEVTRWDTGEFELLSQTEAKLVLQLVGNRLACDATLTRAMDGSDNWRITFTRGTS